MMDPGWPASRDFLRAQAFDALSGAGDATCGEWEEWSSGQAFHLRRRLTVMEQTLVGDACDIRGTPEAHTRLAATRAALPLAHRGLVRDDTPTP